ncbi:hypothetical protein DPEC_G00340590 [Dallia pectoralis]|uniref:Uncharacterized protein n=1 Tax=Dallia pectoralis TaxID=75939 RepID=A0ACC2F5C2_DALPE|nr:hypothetical protein DPEC_G00340590 [Dallia pectoralis]
MQTRRGKWVFVMALSRWMLYTALLVQGTQSSPTLPACTEPCLCHQGPVLNCSFAGLSLVQKHIPSTINDLDLSHNLLASFSLLWPSWGLKNLWIGHNSLTQLSLCVERTWRGEPGRMALSHTRGKCQTWAPSLQLLSAENNQLERIPEGMAGCKFLQVLQLSHNRISVLRPGELSWSPHLKEIHLQHNRISSLNPLALKDLPEIRVLDLSFNMLTTIPSSAYLALRTLNVLVEVKGNRWRCDCSLRSARRWMAYDRDRAQVQSWRGVVCSHPAVHSGRDLLHLEDSDLTCPTPENRPGLHQDVTVDEGTEILLPCSSSNQESTWRTPNGQVPGSPTGLLIRDIAEKDTGLYVCVSGPDEESVSVFDLHVHKTPRKTRGTRSLNVVRLQMNPELGSVQREGQKIDLQRASQWTQSDLILAVCLSVFITLIVAFILGALARPLLDILWGRYCRCCRCTKKSSAQAESVNYAGRGPHDNNAYSDEEREEVGTHKERRVTFSSHSSELGDPNSVPYYDLVATGRQGNQAAEYSGSYESINERDTFHHSLVVSHPPEKEKPSRVDSVSSGSSQQDNHETDTRSGDGDLSNGSLRKPQSGANSVYTHDMEFEPIPNPDELRRSHSSSLSSHSEQDSPNRGQDIDWPLKKSDHQKSKFILKEGDAVKQMVEQINTGSAGAISRCPPESSTNCKNITAGSNPLDPELWNDSGESFEFPDSIRSASARSSSQDLYGSALVDPSRKQSQQAQNDEPLAKDRWENDKSSSSSSHDRGNEFAEYTGNAQHFESSSDSGDEPTTYTVEKARKAVNIEISRQGFQNLPEPETKEPHLHPWVGDPPVPVYIRRFGKRLDIHPPQEAEHATPEKTPPPQYSSRSESEEQTIENSAKHNRQIPDVSQRDSFLNLGDINVSIAPKKAPNIGFSKGGFQYQPEVETKSSSLNISSHIAITPEDQPHKDPLPEEATAEEFPAYIPSFRRHLDIQSSNDIPSSSTCLPRPAGSSSSSSDSEDDTAMNQFRPEESPKVTDSSPSLRGIAVSFSPRKALNIGFSKEGIKYPSEPYCLETAPAAPILPPPAWSTSSSSDSEDETHMYHSREKVKVNVPESSVSLPGLDVSFAPRKALNIGFSKEGIKSPPEPETESAGLDRTTQCAINAKVPVTQPLMSSKLAQVEEPPVPVVFPRFGKRLDFLPHHEAKSVTLKTSPLSESSASSESEEETIENSAKYNSQIPDVSQRDSLLNLGDINVSIAPRRALNIGFSKGGFQYQPEVETKSSSLNLSSHIAITPEDQPHKDPLPEEATAEEFPAYIPSFRRHLDIQSSNDIPSSSTCLPRPAGSSSSSSDSEDDTAMNQYRPEESPKVTDSSPSLRGIDVSFSPRKALNIGFSKESIKYPSEPSSTGVAITSPSAMGINDSLSESSIPSEETWDDRSSGPVFIPRLRRRLDIQSRHDAPPPTPPTSPPTESTYSSRESDDETTRNRKIEQAKSPDSSYSLAGIDVSMAPRKALKVDFSREGYEYESGPYYQETPAASPGSPPPAGSVSPSSESDNETGIYQQREENETKFLESSVILSGFDVSYAPRKALDVGLSKERSYHPHPEDGSRVSDLGLTPQTAVNTKDEGIKDTKPVPQVSLPETSNWRTADEAPIQLYHVPQLRKRLDIRAPRDTPPAVPQTPPPSESSSSSSESDNETTMTRTEEDDKASLPDVKYKYPSVSLGDTPINISFDKRKALSIGKEHFQHQQTESNSRYESSTSKGQGFRHDTIPVSKLPLPKISRFSTTSSERAGPEELTPSPDSSSSSSSESGNELTEPTKKPGRDVADCSFNPGETQIKVSFAPSEALNIGLYNSTSNTDEVDRKTGAEERTNRPGLGGLKVLSERRQWEAEDDISPVQGNIYRTEGSLEEVTDLSSELPSTKTSGFFSTSALTNEARLRESPLEIPHQKRRLVVDIQLPPAPNEAQGTSPSPPEGDEGAGSGWKSRGQQRRAIDGFGRTAQAEEGDKRYMGLLTAKPFSSARPYRRNVASATTTSTRHGGISDRDGSEKGSSASASALHFETHGKGSEA